MVWYGVVWCGVVWCGVVWCGVVWCGVVWCGVVWCGVVWCGVVWCGVVWCGVVWYGMVWYGMVWYGMVWYPHTYLKTLGLVSTARLVSTSTCCLNIGPSVTVGPSSIFTTSFPSVVQNSGKFSLIWSSIRNTTSRSEDPSASSGTHRCISESTIGPICLSTCGPTDLEIWRN